MMPKEFNSLKNTYKVTTTCSKCGSTSSFENGKKGDPSHRNIICANCSKK